MGKHRDLESICDAFEATLQVALVAMAAQGLDAVNSSLGAQYTISMGFWQFTRPDISNLTTIANQALGRTPEVQAADQQRRRDKAAAIKDFKHDVDDFIQQVVRLSGDDQGKLDTALNAAKRGLMLAEDYLR
jgi:soluble cytochrome b562